MFRYSFTVFISSLLLFQIQPIMAKAILPWFGGSSAVWTTCLLFFQVTLLLGYGYAHCLTKLPSRTQLAIHLGLLLAAGFCLPVFPADALKPTGGGELTSGVLMVLASTLGLPFLALSTTGPLIQWWQSRTHPARATYRLFALSNLGSLMALMVYPFWIEPLLSLRYQILIWSLGFVVFAVSVIAAAWQFAFSENKNSSSEQTPISGKLNSDPWRGTLFTYFTWVLLAFSASAMLLATTHQICQEVASIPFLWIVPLTLYLLSFVVCFDRPSWYKWWIFLPLMMTLSVAAFFLLTLRLEVPLPLQITGFSMVLFAGCMACHGELERSKPPAEHLTIFYLMISAGGALGSLFVCVVAPIVFVVPVEFELSVILSIVATLLAFYRLRRVQMDWWATRLSKWLIVPLAGVAICLMVAHPFVQQTKNVKAKLLHASRNAYGSLRVFRYVDAEGAETSRSLFNGTIKHGGEEPWATQRSLPNSYYSKHGGLGIAIRSLRSVRDESELNVGVVGLGAGTIAAWGVAGDRFTFYELNPAVEPIAREFFSYLDDPRGSQSVHVVLGDARLQLESQLKTSGSKNYDLLVIDAFTSDAIPMHLLTTECFGTYRSHVDLDGAIAFHISNRFIDLRPVTASLSRSFGWQAILFNDDGDHEQSDGSRWVIMTRDNALADALYTNPAAERLPQDLKEVVWTDDFGALSPLMNWHKLWSMLRPNTEP